MYAAMKKLGGIDHILARPHVEVHPIWLKGTRVLIKAI